LDFLTIRRRDWIGAGEEDNRRGFGCGLCCKCRWGIESDDHHHLAAQQFAGQRGQALVLTRSPAPFDADVTTFDEASVLEPLEEGGLCTGVSVLVRAV
jgi:hypothetical protein